jgi:hypothetical protein
MSGIYMKYTGLAIYTTCICRVFYGKNVPKGLLNLGKFQG